MQQATYCRAPRSLSAVRRVATFLPWLLAAQVMDDGFHAFFPCLFAFAVDLVVGCGRLAFGWALSIVSLA